MDADILHNGGLENLDNYKIFRRRNPKREPQNIRHLKDWYITEIPNSFKDCPTWICLIGTFKDSIIRTSCITEVISMTKVCTSNCTYTLDFPSKVLEYPLKGLEKHFEFGFPHNWEHLVKNALFPESCLAVCNIENIAQEQTVENFTSMKDDLKFFDFKNQDVENAQTQTDSVKKINLESAEKNKHDFVADLSNTGYTLDNKCDNNTAISSNMINRESFKAIETVDLDRQELGPTKFNTEAQNSKEESFQELEMIDQSSSHINITTPEIFEDKADTTEPQRPEDILNDIDCVLSEAGSKIIPDNYQEIMNFDDSLLTSELTKKKFSKKLTIQEYNKRTSPFYTPLIKKNLTMDKEAYNTTSNKNSFPLDKNAKQTFNTKGDILATVDRPIATYSLSDDNKQKDTELCHNCDQIDHLNEPTKMKFHSNIISIPDFIHQTEAIETPEIPVLVHIEPQVQETSNYIIDSNTDINNENNCDEMLINDFEDHSDIQRQGLTAKEASNLSYDNDCVSNIEDLCQKADVTPKFSQEQSPNVFSSGYKNMECENSSGQNEGAQALNNPIAASSTPAFYIQNEIAEFKNIDESVFDCKKSENVNEMFLNSDQIVLENSSSCSNRKGFKSENLPSVYVDKIVIDESSHVSGSETHVQKQSRLFADKSIADCSEGNKEMNFFTDVNKENIKHIESTSNDVEELKHPKLFDDNLKVESSSDEPLPESESADVSMLAESNKDTVVVKELSDSQPIEPAVNDANKQTLIDGMTQNEVTCKNDQLSLGRNILIKNEASCFNGDIGLKESQSSKVKSSDEPNTFETHDYLVKEDIKQPTFDKKIPVLNCPTAIKDIAVECVNRNDIIKSLENNKCSNIENKSLPVLDIIEDVISNNRLVAEDDSELDSNLRTYTSRSKSMSLPPFASSKLNHEDQIETNADSSPHTDLHGSVPKKRKSGSKKRVKSFKETILHSSKDIEDHTAAKKTSIQIRIPKYTTQNSQKGIKLISDPKNTMCPIESIHVPDSILKLPSLPESDSGISSSKNSIKSIDSKPSKSDNNRRNSLKNMQIDSNLDQSVYLDKSEQVSFKAHHENEFEDEATILTTESSKKLKVERSVIKKPENSAMKCENNTLSLESYALTQPVPVEFDTGLPSKRDSQASETEHPNLCDTIIEEDSDQKDSTSLPLKVVNSIDQETQKSSKKIKKKRKLMVMPKKLKGFKKS